MLYSGFLSVNLPHNLYFNVLQVFAEQVCKNKEKVRLQKKPSLTMECKKGDWYPNEGRSGPGGPPCEDNPALLANGTCSADRGACSQFTERGLEMDRDCAGTCGQYNCGIICIFRQL